MILQRRSLILTALAAPFVARVPGLLMPVKPVRRALPIVRLNVDLRPREIARGDCYFDTASREVRVWDGVGWLRYAAPDGFAA